MGPTRQTGRRFGWLTRPEGGIVLGALMVGLLLWARLLLITDHPRTAIADPDQVRATEPTPPDEGESPVRTEEQVPKP